MTMGKNHHNLKMLSCSLLYKKQKVDFPASHVCLLSIYIFQGLAMNPNPNEERRTNNPNFCPPHLRHIAFRYLCELGIRSILGGKIRQRFRANNELNDLPSLKLTFSPLKIGHPNRKGLYSNHPFSGAKNMLVSGRVNSLCLKYWEHFGRGDSLTKSPLGGG